MFFTDLVVMEFCSVTVMVKAPPAWAVSGSMTVLLMYTTGSAVAVSTTGWATFSTFPSVMVMYRVKLVFTALPEASKPEVFTVTG